MKWDELTEEQKDAVIEATANGVGGAYDCMRVWSAWSYGTMGEDDFLPVRDSSERLVDIARAVVEALPSPTAAMVPWEPRGWPTKEQVRAWVRQDKGQGWMMLGYGRVNFAVRQYSDRGPGWVQVGVAKGTTTHVPFCIASDGPISGVVPTINDTPVSWTAVDAAVKAMEAK